MGAIKDVIDLVNELNSKVEDRKFAGELRQIQSMIGTIQAEHAEIHEQRISLMTKNAELKQDISGLKERIMILERQLLEKSQLGTTTSATLCNEEEQILLILSESQEAVEQSIANRLGQSLTKTQFWITRLNDLGMIRQNIGFYSNGEYYLEQPGREYLVKHNLI